MPGRDVKNPYMREFWRGYEKGKSEATAAERERLMEVVCESCGQVDCQGCLGGADWHKRITRAEYLRPHPEAGDSDCD